MKFQIGEVIVPMLMVTVITLIYQIYTLPSKISDALNLPAKDTLRVLVPDNLTVKNDLVYFEGDLVDSSIKINDDYQYNPAYPKEIWDGYLTPIISIGGAKYLLWSRLKIDNTENIKGWFTPLKGNWQYKHEKIYLQALLPIVRRDS